MALCDVPTVRRNPKRLSLFSISFALSLCLSPSFSRSALCTYPHCLYFLILFTSARDHLWKWSGKGMRREICLFRKLNKCSVASLRSKTGFISPFFTRKEIKKKGNRPVSIETWKPSPEIDFPFIILINIIIVILSLTAFTQIYVWSI